MHSKIHESFYQVFRLLTFEFPRGGRVRSNEVQLAQGILRKMCGKSRLENKEKYLALLLSNFPTETFHTFFSKHLG